MRLICFETDLQTSEKSRPLFIFKEYHCSQRIINGRKFNVADCPDPLYFSMKLQRLVQYPVYENLEGLKSMKVLVLGAGAVGGYFGGRLAENGVDVTFLVRPERAKNLRKSGLQIVSSCGSYHSSDIQVVEKVSDRYDVVIISCKAWDLDSAMDSITPAVGDNTAVFPLLNGIRHLETLQSRFGQRAVIGGLCIISSTVDSEGKIMHLNDKHSIKYGELSSETSERIKELNQAFQGAICDPHLSTQIESDMWEKWVMISSLAALTTSMRATIGEIAQSPYGADLSSRIFDECMAVANAYGYKPKENYGARLQEKDSKLTASMLRDMQNGNKIEADQILGDLIARGEKKGISVPNLKTAYCNLKVYELQHARNAVPAGCN
jgi:2-dehydropantoate 2-reductase